MADRNQSKTSGRGWIPSTGFLFVVVTVVPMVIGIHLGTYLGHIAPGGLLGAVVGIVLAVWLVIRPIWLDADKEHEKNTDSN